MPINHALNPQSQEKKTLLVLFVSLVLHCSPGNLGQRPAGLTERYTACVPLWKERVWAPWPPLSTIKAITLPPHPGHRIACVELQRQHCAPHGWLGNRNSLTTHRKERRNKQNHQKPQSEPAHSRHQLVQPEQTPRQRLTRDRQSKSEGDGKCLMWLATPRL